MSDEEKTLYEKLQTEIEQAHWKLLEEHHKREALFYIEDDLDLCLVGQAIAEDKVSAIKQWLDLGSLTRPTEEMVEQFDKDEERKYNFIIIQPYVLMQNIKEEE